MKKIILVVVTFMTVVGVAFAVSCYKYHYVLSVHCSKCKQYQTIEVDRNDFNGVCSYVKSNFTNHSKDCGWKGNSKLEITTTSKSKNDYEKCN